MYALHDSTTTNCVSNAQSCVHQTIFGTGRIDVSLELRMYVGAEDVAADRVIIKGVPNVEMEIKEGAHGDRATAAMVVNSIPRVVVARPGLLTMDAHQLPVARAAAAGRTEAECRSQNAG